MTEATESKRKSLYCKNVAKKYQIHSKEIQQQMLKSQGCIGNDRYNDRNEFDDVIKEEKERLEKEALNDIREDEERQRQVKDEQEHNVKEAEALQYFAKLDKNGDGYITKDELIEIQKMINEVKNEVKNEIKNEVKNEVNKPFSTISNLTAIIAQIFGLCLVLIIGFGSLPYCVSLVSEIILLAYICYQKHKKNEDYEEEYQLLKAQSQFLTYMFIVICAKYFL